MSKGLYFTTILPPDDIREKVQVIKKEFIEKYNSKEAYNNPPYFTLRAPY